MLTSRTSVSHLHVQTDIGRLSPISISSGLGTPVDPRPDIGRYLKNGWAISVETSETINSQLFLSFPLRSVTRESRPLHGDHGCPVHRSATSPKWPQTHLKNIIYLIWEQCVTRGSVFHPTIPNDFFVLSLPDLVQGLSLPYLYKVKRQRLTVDRLPGYLLSRSN